ncbi:CGNR zinc finger domain-containing protein [Streptomyces sp. NBC_00237]|uniref:CGNR zinc finger domain-containing protein n=1 Tax=Streptomyces sp. NBC_00237 TaxID=2975687 RepID=UPI002251751D|nr:CGNR zinc finger domain-containing protein [Streptomyces sp. NBC_00237]MCX5206573.1 CGNR zinc finger domain-containing protein [Streptomyces sp. NBC_00237]
MKILFSRYATGAGVATGLVNTSAHVRTDIGEVLTGPAELTAFLAEHDVRLDALPPGTPPTDHDLTQVLALREETRGLLEAATEQEVAEGANRLAARATSGLSLLRDADGHWQWHVTTAPGASAADELAALVGTGLLGVLHTLSHDRFRPCASPTCTGLFVDTSKAGRRRYCIPHLCGNRLNVAKHRARQQAAE